MSAEGGATLAEAITASFYAWEVRGRGWLLAEYPVRLEPPHRPFFLLPDWRGASTEIIDDGKRHTFVSAAWKWLSEDIWKDDTPLPEPEPFEEPLPVPEAERAPLVSLSITPPPDFDAKSDTARRLVVALGAATEPVAWEIIGREGHVTFQVTCAECDVPLVCDALSAYAPGVVAREVEDAIDEAKWHAVEIRVIDFGLASEFFLPLNTDHGKHVDNYASLIAALARCGEDEFIAIQILFAPTLNPWARTIMHAVTADDGESMIGDAPHFPALAAEKVSEPLASAVLRVAIGADEIERIRALLSGLQTFLRGFTRPGGNELAPLDEASEDVTGVLERTSTRTGMILSAAELAGLVHIPDASVKHPALRGNEGKTLPLPKEARGHAFVLGDNLHHGEKIPATLSAEARSAHTHIVGATGTGKSTLLLDLMLQDIRAGEGIAVFDPHGDLVDEILARFPMNRVRDAVVFDPTDSEWPIGINILSAQSEIEKNLIASDLVGVFRRLSTSWGDTMNAVLGNAVLAFLDHPEGGTLVELRQFLVDAEERAAFLARVSDPHIRFFWEKEFPLIGTRSIGPILTRLDTFLRPKLIRNIVGEKSGKCDLGAIVNGRKVFLAKLSQGLLGEENAHLLGALLMSKIHQVALGRQAIPKKERTPFHVYADEAQHVVSHSLPASLTELRKYYLDFTLSHQMSEQMKKVPEMEAALQNAYTRIVLRVGSDDAKKYAEDMVGVEASDLSSLPRGHAVVRMGSSAHTFTLSVRGPERVSEHEARARREAVIAASREQYACLRARLSEDARRQADTHRQASPRSVLPETVTAQPVTASPPVSLSKDEPRQAPPKREAPAMVRPPPSAGRGGQEHKYLQHLLKRLAEERGFRATIEDAGTNGESVDVVLRNQAIAIACEISITTDVEHETSNVEKCISLGFSRIVLISPNARRRERLSKQIAARSLSVPVDVIEPEGIVAFLDQFTEDEQPAEHRVRGYKVKVTRQKLSPGEAAAKRAAVAEVIARTMRKASVSAGDSVCRR